MTDIRRLSEMVYVGLCHKIGTRKEVSERREIADITEVLHDKIDLFRGEIRMLSGSYREGFRLSGSDRDSMFWLRDHKVIFDLSQTQQYRQPGTALFLMEFADSRPGFVLLQPLTQSNDYIVSSSCININDVSYLSSSLYRKHLLNVYSRGFKEHGPCVNKVFQYNEHDIAHCFSCDFWPPLAASWIDRCTSWPSPSVLYEIIVSGCHFMAIGSKGSPNEDKEWRLSFSQAEQKLVYATNHCQFLVYGLLKLFLKEVINEIDQEKLLCSYFFKTALFWEIQENKITQWCPQNILLCFWACYKRIIKCVYTGYCPNFFVTENNMFFGKICGSSQRILFLNLYKMYEKGMSCLLSCKSIRSCLFNTICHPINRPNLHEISRSSEENHFGDIILQLFDNLSRDHTKLLRCLQIMKDLSRTNLTKIQVLYLRISAARCITDSAFCRQQHYIGGNKTMYNVDMSTFNMLKTVALSGSVSDMLFLAMYYYSTCRYKEALSVLHKTEVQLTQHTLTYTGDMEKDVLEIGGLCLLDRLTDFIHRVVVLKNDIIYFNQLMLEQRISTGNEKTKLYIPPLVLLRLLYVLCYSHVNTERRQEALNDLNILVHYDTWRYIVDHSRDISYQILGICQEICGDFHGAINSYNLSLDCIPHNDIREASLIRIQHAYSKLRNLC